MPPPPLNVLHVVLSLEPGGMENGIVNVANRLDPNCFRLHICCLERRGAFADRLRDDIPVTVLDKPPGKSLRTLRRLHRLIGVTQPDLVHSHNFGPLIYAVPACHWGLRTPVCHGEHAELIPPDLAADRLRLRRWLYRGCRAVHTVSRSVTLHLDELALFRGTVDTVVNGVDTDRFAPRPPSSAIAERIPGTATPLTIGMVARFGEYKRHHLLVSAFDAIAADHPHLRLLFVGAAGPCEAAVRAQASACNAAGRIHFLGFQPDPAPYYPLLDLLVIPSINEGLSNAALEAMATGVPVLSHRNCGASEVITDNHDGWVADLDDAKSLADRLSPLLADPDTLERAGKRARQTVVERFSIDAMVQGYADLYRRATTTATP